MNGKARQLMNCVDDYERGVLCQGWAHEARLRWYQGQAETIDDVVNSQSLQYRFMNREAREAAAMLRWGKSAVGHDLAEADQMYTRWAGGYFAAYSTRLAAARARSEHVIRR
jgi:hypothetical protein